MFSLHSSTSLLSPLSQPFPLSRIAKCGILAEEGGPVMRAIVWFVLLLLFMA